MILNEMPFRRFYFFDKVQGPVGTAGVPARIIDLLVGTAGVPARNR